LRRAIDDHRLDDGQVGGDARQHLAGAGLQEEGLIEGQDVIVEHLAQVGGDPLAELGDVIEPRRRADREHDDHGGEQQEGVAQRLIGVHLHAAVDDHLHRPAEAKGRAGGDQQEDDRQDGVDHVGADEGPDVRKRPQITRARPALGRLRDLLGEKNTRRRSATGDCLRRVLPAHLTSNACIPCFDLPWRGAFVYSRPSSWPAGMTSRLAARPSRVGPNPP